MAKIRRFEHYTDTELVAYLANAGCDLMAEGELAARVVRGDFQMPDAVDLAARVEELEGELGEADEKYKTFLHSIKDVVEEATAP